ncbi:AarF/UbiB family protein [Alcanivorax sp.]|uniref:AarF/UbiB family protein n=1 Tax=Alcanivorax sp. TaxID=1872427 RepID=UPI003BAD2CD9
MKSWELDMTLLKIFMGAVKSALPPMDIDTIVSEIQRTVREELDYEREARVMTQIGEQLAGIPGNHHPGPGGGTQQPACADHRIRPRSQTHHRAG